MTTTEEFQHSIAVSENPILELRQHKAEGGGHISRAGWFADIRALPKRAILRTLQSMAILSRKMARGDT